MKDRNWKIPIFVTLSLFGGVFLIHRVSLFRDVISGAGDAKTITTTIYATLIAILLALLALAITAYIFVAGFLKDQQKPYEKKSIDSLLRIYTACLVILTISSLLSLLCCFWIDNADKPVPVADWMPPVVIAFSSVVSLFLLVYTCCVICHDGCLRIFARYARKKLFSEKGKSAPPNQIDGVFKWIGDIEMLAERLI